MSAHFVHEAARECIIVGSMEHMLVGTNTSQVDTHHGQRTGDTDNEGAMRSLVVRLPESFPKPLLKHWIFKPIVSDLHVQLDMMLSFGITLELHRLVWDAANEKSFTKPLRCASCLKPANAPTRYS